MYTKRYEPEQIQTFREPQGRIERADCEPREEYRSDAEVCAAHTNLAERIADRRDQEQQEEGILGEEPHHCRSVIVDWTEPESGSKNRNNSCSE